MLRPERNDDRTESALLFVPDDARAFLQGRISEYGRDPGTPGFSGADLANLVNEAALLATRRKGDAVTMDDFNNAVERIIAGLEKKNRVLNLLSGVE